MPNQTPPDSGPRPRPTGAPPSPSGPPDPAPPKRLRAVDDPPRGQAYPPIPPHIARRLGLIVAPAVRTAKRTEHARAA
ncbi:hypothetical protein [Glycomyces arizonensis]|uniref:hypothetical protein n=1 Tax=Glycomyces arizonensis TaxID=256035 RepID=UPI00041E8891|nr:hypothetical protein [Glycomyces arizonensis]